MRKINIKKLRLKSVYTRYMLIFMAIMFFTVAILGILVTTIARNYATETKKNELSETNRLFRTTVLAMNGEYETLESAKKYLSSQSFSFPVYFDVNNDAFHSFELYGFPNVPRTYLFYTGGIPAKQSNPSILLYSGMLDEGIAIILP